MTYNFCEWSRVSTSVLLLRDASFLESYREAMNAWYNFLFVNLFATSCFFPCRFGGDDDWLKLWRWKIASRSDNQREGSPVWSENRHGSVIPWRLSSTDWLTSFLNIRFISCLTMFAHPASGIIQKLRWARLRSLTLKRFERGKQSWMRYRKSAQPCGSQQSVSGTTFGWHSLDKFVRVFIFACEWYAVNDNCYGFTWPMQATWIRPANCMQISQPASIWTPGSMSMNMAKRRKWNLRQSKRDAIQMLLSAMLILIPLRTMCPSLNYLANCELFSWVSNCCSRRIWIRLWHIHIFIMMSSCQNEEVTLGILSPLKKWLATFDNLEVIIICPCPVVLQCLWCFVLDCIPMNLCDSCYLNDMSLLVNLFIWRKPPMWYVVITLSLSCTYVQTGPPVWH